MNAISNLVTGDADAAVTWYAEALATVHHFRLKDASDFAVRLRVTPAEWVAIDDAWTAMLTATGAILAPALALSFATSFARARARLMQSTEEPSPLRELPSYLRRPPMSRSEPAPALTEPCAAGAVAAMGIDHREEPASESASWDPPKSPAPASETPPAREARSPAAPAQPSYQAAPPPATSAQRSALAGTALGSAPSPGPALPFAPLPPGMPAPRVKRARPPAQFTGTADGVDVPQGPALPFVPSDAPPAVPELTLEQYADLRAQLALRGEEDAETWKQFGVTSRTVKEALQARFAARFRQDPAMQARFVDLVQKRSAELRAR